MWGIIYTQTKISMGMAMAPSPSLVTEFFVTGEIGQWRSQQGGRVGQDDPP
jgi:hypothetical protein